ncbi:Tyrosine-protein phosphatase non-receptor type 9 [Borealophlyctis nickersoniae]|nr:Tyrosine-protein phosphatase non-receptor type 9 [Borealophlyctis nickersoniae]
MLDIRFPFDARPVSVFEGPTYANIHLIHYLNVPLFYLPGAADRNGAAVMVFNVRYWSGDDAGVRRKLKLLHYICDKAVSSFQTQHNGMIVISNLEGVDNRSKIIDSHRWLLEMLEYVLPVRVKHVLLYKAPWMAAMFPYAYSPGVCDAGPLVTEMQFCNDLTAHVDERSLPKELGGQSIYKQKEWIADQLRREESSDNGTLVETNMSSMRARLFDSTAPSPPDSPSLAGSPSLQIPLGLSTPSSIGTSSDNTPSYFDLEPRSSSPNGHVDGPIEVDGKISREHAIGGVLEPPVRKSSAARSNGNGVVASRKMSVSSVEESKLNGSAPMGNGDKHGSKKNAVTPPAVESELTSFDGLQQHGRVELEAR